MANCPECNTMLGTRGCLNHECSLYVRGPFSPSEETLEAARKRRDARIREHNKRIKDGSKP